MNEERNRAAARLLIDLYTAGHIDRPWLDGMLVSGIVGYGADEKRVTGRVSKVEGQYPCIYAKRDFKKETASWAVLHDAYPVLEDPLTLVGVTMILEALVGRPLGDELTRALYDFVLSGQLVQPSLVPGQP